MVVGIKKLVGTPVWHQAEVERVRDSHSSIMASSWDQSRSQSAQTLLKELWSSARLARCSTTTRSRMSQNQTTLRTKSMSRTGSRGQTGLGRKIQLQELTQTLQKGPWKKDSKRLRGHSRRTQTRISQLQDLLWPGPSHPPPHHPHRHTKLLRESVSRLVLHC